MRKASLIITPVLGFAIFAPKAEAQDYSPNESACVTHIFKQTYGFANGDDLYTNGCDYPVFVYVVFNRNKNGGFGLDLGPQKAGGTGHSKAMYDEMGGALIHVCRAGYRPVDMDGKRIYTNGADEYQCKKQ